jgi:predicted tellurium resistance membrane protein TerC
VIGLLISIPIVVFGSTLVLKLVQRYPLIIQLGAAVLAFTAARMIVNEPLLDAVFDASGPFNIAARWATYALAVVGVLAAGWWSGRRPADERRHPTGHAA